MTLSDLAAAALRELAKRRVRALSPWRQPMPFSDDESRLDALQQQVALLDLLHQLRTEVETLTQALNQRRQGGADAWPRR
jgi:hypothetical protein